jgi:hypothetical protein
MNKELLATLQLIDPDTLTSEQSRLILSCLEEFYQIILNQREENQRLKDEINRLKGEQGKPDIKGDKKKKSQEQSKDISSESERKEGKVKRQAKRIKFDGNQQIDETIDCPLDRSELPSDAEFKGYAKSYYQSLEIRGKTILVKREIYYSPSEGKTYSAPFPIGFEEGSDYREELKSHIIMFKFGYGMSEKKILELLLNSGINITAGTISNILTGKGKELSSERDEIYQAGRDAGSYQQTDSTGSRENGVNRHCHILTNDFYTAYFTEPKKDRMTILDILRGKKPRQYLLNETTFDIMSYLRMSKPLIASLGELSADRLMDEEGYLSKLAAHLGSDRLEKDKGKLLESAYLAAYHAEDPIEALVCDDAPQYKLLALLVVLCWVHEGRHYKKLNPLFKHHRKLLEQFITDFWAFYHKLVAYKKAPDPAKALELEGQFDDLTARVTGYKDLDERIAKTKKKKESLLAVLKQPDLPLHNNQSELGARVEVRFRDVSLQTRSPKGTKAKDTFFTIIQTAKKLGVNPYAYIMDRITKKFEMDSLANIIKRKASLI